MENYYKRKYKWYLERAKEAKSSTSDKGFLKWLDETFPEIKEHEDEKIRKEIISFLENIGIEEIKKIPRDICEWFAWLEKQKKPKDDTVGTFSYGSEGPSQLDLAHAINQKKEFLKQKPVEWSEEDEEYLQNIVDWIECLIDDEDCGDMSYEEHKNFYLKRINWLKSFKPQPKQEWGEDDEYQINTILHGLDLKRELYKKEGNKVEEERYKTQYDWLKSIKDRVQPQPKQEWSEDDERIRQCLIRDQEKALDEVHNDKYGHSEIISDLKEMYRERIDWLESLNPKKHWKPSEEQMEALCNVAFNFGNSCLSPYSDKNKELASLYNDLKNL